MNLFQRRTERGFTLVELMVAGAAFAVVSLAGFAVLSTGQRSAVMNDQTVQIQRNVRLAMDLITRDIRMAGFGNPAAGVLPGCANTINTGDNAVGDDAGPDTISVMTVFQQIGTLQNAFTDANIIKVQNLAPGVAVNDVISLEGAFTATVNAVNAGTGELTLNQSILAPTNYAAGAAVVQLTCIRYTVSGTAASPPYQLLRQVNVNPAVPIVDGIESLQLAYAVDADNDGVIDDQPGGVAAQPDCKDFIPNDSPNNQVCLFQLIAGSAGLAVGTPGYRAANATPSAVRQVRITVVGRAIPPANANVPGNTWSDPTFKSNSSVRAEDQLLPNAPGIRRRSLMRMVTLRNGAN